MKKTIMVMFAFTMAAMLFAAGSQSGSGQAAGAAADGTTKKLVVWSYMNEGEPVGRWHEEVTEKFRQMYPGVDVELVLCGREILTRFRTKLQDKNAADFPDLVSQGTATITPLAADGIIIPLDNYLKNEKNLEGTKVWGETFIPNLMEANKYKGMNYFIPEGLYAAGFFYDENMFAKYNLAVPKTWDEFLAVCDKLKANGISPLAQDGTNGGYNNWYILRFAERLAGLDKLQQAARGELSWKAEPAFLESAKYVAALNTRGYFQNGFAGSVFPAAQALITQGTAGMIHMGAWFPTEMASQTPATMKMNMFAFPLIPNSVSERHEELWSNCFAVTADGKNKQNAINWLKIHSSVEMQTKKATLKNPTVLVNGPVVPEVREIANIVNNATSLSPIQSGLNSYGAWVATVMHPLTTQLITGQITPEQYIDKLDADTKSFYKK